MDGLSIDRQASLTEARALRFLLGFTVGTVFGLAIAAILVRESMENGDFDP